MKILNENENVKYTFRLIQCHKDIPNMKEWYWYIDNLRMMEILMEKTVNRYAGTSDSPIFAVLDNEKDRTRINLMDTINIAIILCLNQI